ncbi:PREDICTED: uncharacterized protein LOC108562132 [Nicrophorus vespilloides]|uniref:Uncharacterized protein LOC108562132 n=1 Tax=Nicrophorus vespilloides TaxID=110193 RepID=A0ABM1MMM8_NICVS|nr:PREDICTED: uncharacterized protein LOC108562132 [Nicrophorus vespilloides]
MEQYYSSDDDVCWGPPTLREIKRSLKRPIDRDHINRRRTIGYNSPLKQESMVQTPEPDHIKDIIEDVSKLSIKSTYYTPNETMLPEKVDAANTSQFCQDVEAPNTSRFCEEISKILDDTEPVTFVTATTDLSTESLLPQSIAIIDKLKSTLDSIMLTKKNFKVGSNVTLMGNRVQCTDLIDNVEMTLAPIESSDEDEDKEITNNIENIIQKLSVDNSDYEDDLNTKQENFVDSAFQQIKLSEVIEISDDESLEVHEIEQTFADTSECQNISDDNEQDFELGKSNKRIMSEIEENFDNAEISIEEKIEEKNEILRFQGTQSQYEDISCIEDTDLHKINNKAAVLEDSHNDSEASFEYKCMRNTPNDVYSIGDENKAENSVYNIVNNEDVSMSDDENMYEENKENDRSEYVFDDTLEEINRALNEGLDYDSPSEKLNSPVEKSSAKKVSYESKLKPPNEYNILKTVKPQMEQLMVTPDFKQPMRPMRRSPTPMHQRNALNFREIVSPVAVYIKSSATPLQKNVNLRMMDQLPKKIVAKSPSTKQKFCALPDVVYRPASKKCLTKEKEIKFGGKIEKLLFTKPEVIRHEKKFISKPINVQQKLLENNLTINSSHSSIMDATQDVSVLTSKKTFIR